MAQPKLETVAERAIHAADGTRWKVREARAIEIPGAMATTCLIFDSATVCRRVWWYPDEWAQLPEDDLLAILEHPR